MPLIPFSLDFDYCSGDDSGEAGDYSLPIPYKWAMAQEVRFNLKRVIGCCFLHDVDEMLRIFWNFGLLFCAALSG